MGPDEDKQSEEEQSDHRIRRRVHVLLPARIEADGRQWEVRLRNLSSTGALIETDAVLAPDTPMTFVRAGAIRDGKVVWSKGGRMGLTFDRSFSEDEVTALTRRERPAGSPMRRG